MGLVTCQTSTASPGNSPGSDSWNDPDFFVSCPGGLLLDESLCLPKDYRRLSKPDGPVDVSLHLEITDILEIEDHKQTISLGMLLGMSWVDDRFEVAKKQWWTESFGDDHEHRINSLPLGGETINKVINT